MSHIKELVLLASELTNEIKENILESVKLEDEFTVEKVSIGRTVTNTYGLDEIMFIISTNLSDYHVIVKHTFGKITVDASGFPVTQSQADDDALVAIFSNIPIDQFDNLVMECKIEQEKLFDILNSVVEFKDMHRRRISFVSCSPLLSYKQLADYVVGMKIIGIDKNDPYINRITIPLDDNIVHSPITSTDEFEEEFENPEEVKTTIFNFFQGITSGDDAEPHDPINNYYNVNQLTKVMPSIKLSMENYKDAKIKAHLDESWETLEKQKPINHKCEFKEGLITRIINKIKRFFNK